MTRIRELWIDGFGCLRTARDPFRFDDERITLFLNDNEAGKTTLQMALLASLYGVETHKGKLHSRALLRPHQLHWMPFTGPPFGTRLLLHDGQQRLEVRWDFASEGAFRVINLETNEEITETLCPGRDPLLLGRRLLGLSLEEFAKTCLVRQDDLARVCDTEGLDALVQRAADTQAGDATVASAQDRLGDLLRNYPGVTLKEAGRIETEIARLQDDAEALQRQLAALAGERAAIADEDAQFQRLAGECEELRREAARFDYLAQVAKQDELKQQVAEALKRRAALAELDAERKALAPLEKFPADMEDQLTQWQVTRLGLLRDAAQAERTIAEIRRNALEPARRELDSLQRLAAVSQNDIDGVTELLGKTRDFEAREQRLRYTIEAHERQLTDEGASVEELDRLEERFARLEPQDGEFLTGHERAAEQAAAESEDAARLAGNATLRVDQVLAERAGQREAARRSVLFGMAVAGGALVAGGLLAILRLAAGIVLGLAGLGAGLMLLVKGQRAAAAAESLRSDELAEARLALAQFGERREQLAAEQRESDDRLKALAARFGYEQPDVLVEDYRSLDDLRRLCGALIHLRSQEAELAAQREALEREVDARFQAYAEPRPLSASLTSALADLQERMGRSLHLRRRIDELSRTIADHAARRDALRAEADALTARISEVLARAGVGNMESVEEAIDAFNERLQRYLRYRQLSDDLIPLASSTVVDPAVIQAWEADIERLHRATTTLREERPSLVSLQVADRSSEYERQRATVRQRLDELRVKAEEMGRHVVDVLRRYHAEYPKLEEDLAERRQQLARAYRHKAALETAIQVLDDIGREVHGRWAEELNRATSQYLQRVVPTLSDLKFDSRLCFGVWHTGGQTPVRGSEASRPVLSAGTWDQLYFAVRLGLGDFVARRGGGGILLLDDPFAHFDDRRFEAAVRLLAELAGGRHQTILMSCQRQRFEWLRSRDPQWFATHVAPRSVRAENRLPT